MIRLDSRENAVKNFDIPKNTFTTHSYVFELAFFECPGVLAGSASTKVNSK